MVKEKMTYINGNIGVYEGSWKEHKLHGRGTFTKPDGTKDDFIFKNGRRAEALDFSDKLFLFFEEGETSFIYEGLLLIKKNRIRE